ncbi:MAG: hypothetical protein IPN40_07040 [Uliginosibacterium sp.]|nr:hypothetical protein [Uliginosibacterium sp.]
MPTRVPWLPMKEDFSFSAKSGSVQRDTPQVDPYGDGYYTPIDLGMTSEDDDAKRARLIDGLDQAEWVIIPNNRFYSTMTRNPLRYPLSSQFYDALFEGTLGFARERVVSSPPRLAGLVIQDQVSPEAQVRCPVVSHSPGLQKKLSAFTIIRRSTYSERRRPIRASASCRGFPA